MPALDLECAETQPPRGCCSAKTGSSYYKYDQLGAPVEYRPPLLRGKPEIPWQRYVDSLTRGARANTYGISLSVYAGLA